MWKQPPIDVSKLPREPGVYRMLDGKRTVLYVGKARNLRKRVASYFQRRPDSPRIAAMVSRVADIAITVTASEAEALVLEHNLIKQLKPRYNVLLKDAKSYPYILLTDEDYPRLKLYRGPRRAKGEYFGPFPDAGAVRTTLHALQQAFLLRDCENSVFRNRSRPCMQHQIGRCSAPCCNVVSQSEYAAQVAEARAFLKGCNSQLLERWQAEMTRAAAALDFETAAKLRDRIRALRGILAVADHAALPENADAVGVLRHAAGVSVCVGMRRGGRDLGTYTVRVGQAADADELEILQAWLIERYREEPPPSELLVDIGQEGREALRRLLRLLQPQQRCRVLQPVRGARRQWWQRVIHAGEQSMAGSAGESMGPAFAALAELLNLPEVPQCIAAVDNAHLGGKQTVAAIVYANRDGLDKAHYRRYKLDDVPAGDDYAAMQRVLSRFFCAINNEEMPLPDVMFIDGGRGQLAVALHAAADAGLGHLKLVAVAKGKSRRLGEETLWPGWTGADVPGLGMPLHPGRHSPALLLIARVRDEAHRFAGSYLKKRRKKALFKSQLDAVPGIGPARRAALLKHFGGIEGVKKASREQLAATPGISAALAERIFTYLHR